MTRFSRVGSVLPDALQQTAVLRTARAQRAMRQWNRIVGPFLAERSQPDRFERGILYVAVSGAAWAQELRMMKDRILSGLASVAMERDLFKDVRFGVRKFTVPSTEMDVEFKPDIDYSLSIREIANERIRRRNADSRD